MDDPRTRRAPVPHPSSTVTTLRALVMLACLVGIPIIALRGTAVPGLIRQFLVEKLGGTAPKAEARADLDDAPPFVPQGSRPAESPLDHRASETMRGAAPGIEAPHHGSIGSNYQQPVGAPQPWDNRQGVGPRGRPAAAGTVGGGSQSRIESGRDAVLANYDSPSGSLGSVTSPIPSGFPRESDRGQAHGLGAEAAPNGRFGPNPPHQAAPGVGRPDTIDQFIYIQRRLRDLGADYYLLENWGDQGEYYRFHCRIAVANSANFTKHFEATDQHPLGAMTQVLADVESWRRGSAVWDAPPARTTETSQFPATPPRAKSSPYGS